MAKHFKVTLMDNLIIASRTINTVPDNYAKAKVTFLHPRDYNAFS